MNFANITTYINSERRTTIKDLLYNPTEELKLTDVLAYLFLEISLNNANRAGEARNMLASEYNSAKLRDGFKIIKIREHKTYYKYGPANVVVDNDLAQDLDAYYNNIRPSYSQMHNSKYFFLSNSGKRLTSGSPRKIMQQLWESTEAAGQRQL